MEKDVDSRISFSLPFSKSVFMNSQNAAIKVPVVLLSIEVEAE